jgi:hypothetical protein
MLICSTVSQAALTLASAHTKKSGNETYQNLLLSKKKSEREREIKSRERVAGG